MPHVTLLALAAGLSLSSNTNGAQPDADDTSRIYRVVGDPEELYVTRDGDAYRAGQSSTESPLPEGYPAPTPPGAIEIKSYPSVRRAQVSGDSGMDAGAMQGFWPLFRHIQKNDIAMTAPVEMIYTGEGMPEPETPSLETHTNDEGESWSMSFLYRTADLGPTGTDGRIEIIDAEPVMVLSMGVRGRLNQVQTREGIRELQEWVERDPRFEIAGHARTLGYNGPSVPRAIQWWEIQIPIREVEHDTAVSDD